jgi:2-(1,2-epoxy-1,2-dihydrophenyl)acetyl-CoA isomerase
VATITLNRPESLNALNATMRREMQAALKAAARDDATRAVIITGEPLTARGAADAGLVAAVVPHDELQAAAGDLARRLASGPTKAFGYAKRLINAAEDDTLAEALEREAALQELAGRTADHAEGLAAFTEKREPRFEGR